MYTLKLWLRLYDSAIKFSKCSVKKPCYLYAINRVSINKESLCACLSNQTLQCVSNLCNNWCPTSRKASGITATNMRLWVGTETAAHWCQNKSEPRTSNTIHLGDASTSKLFDFRVNFSTWNNVNWIDPLQTPQNLPHIKYFKCLFQKSVLVINDKTSFFSTIECFCL